MIEYDAFSSEEEIKETLQPADGKHGGGPVLYVDWETGEAYSDTSEANGIFLGVTGCGKTRRGTLPLTMTLIQGGESFISVDPKGDIYENTHELAKKNGYLTKVFDFRDITRSDGFDLFAYPYMLYKSEDPGDKQLGIEILDDIASCLYGDDMQISAQKDPFWDRSAKTVFLALMYQLFEFGKEEHIHPMSLSSIAYENFSRDTSGSSGIPGSRIIDLLCEANPNAPFVPLMSTVRLAPRDSTQPSILACFFQPLSVFRKNPAIADFLCDGSFSMSELDGKRKTAIYIILPDESHNYSALASIMLTQFVSHFIRIAHTKYEGKLPRRMNIVIEELGNIGDSFPKLDLLMSAGRSRNLRTFFVLQSFSQLDTLYGVTKAQTILGNADTIIAYRTENLDTLRELSERCGKRFNMETHCYEPIVTPTQLGSLGTGEVLVLKGGKLKYIFELPDLEELMTCKIPKAKAHIPSKGHTKTQILRLAPIVKDILDKKSEERRRKMEEMQKAEIMKELREQTKEKDKPAPDSPSSGTVPDLADESATANYYVVVNCMGMSPETIKKVQEDAKQYSHRARYNTKESSIVVYFSLFHNAVSYKFTVRQRFREVRDVMLREV